ncbi:MULTISPECIES: CidA/LrgA family protein [Mammaliicoccus]|uniref:CidA/LrgA family protein n=1 Tax=Mammaliicoccus sciuri TaxID=1296 RepID=A0AAJ4SKD3_MAMSC|nr:MULTISPECIES: CidA/LrgA family protein [Mammaliicoccus]MBF9297957.1 CidA/LrgA family protein [Staphylococcus schleiferi]MBN4912335.1 CidA/LrgA family protein [Staphylococcus sp. EG-SA-13]MCD8836488.1 CidA/LrgA family protein [Mammaliicoccus sciuri]MCJ0911921.1 CidA/LrgA family protein [Mammaliicoccus sciuri]MCJ0940855.1 CidA/LrgA family protein [Mammaliicoccus sciuri]
MIYKFIKIILQICMIYFITVLGSWIQDTLNIPIAGSIIGLVILFLLLQFKIIKEEWIKDGANLLLSTMIFFFIPSIVGAMNLVDQINAQFIFLIVLVIASTCIVALSSGYIAEKMLKRNHIEESGDQS